MGFKLRMSAGTDPEGFPHHENFYTSLVACGILRARVQMNAFADLRIWWTEETEKDEPDGDWSELVTLDFRLQVLQKWPISGLFHDIRLESDTALVVVETKVDAELDEEQVGPVFRCLSDLKDTRTRAYLLMAPGGYGGRKFHPGTLSKFYKAAEDGVRAGFVNLALATNWAGELLGLHQLV